MSIETVAQLKQQKADIAAKIKELEEIPDATNKPIWFILIRIIAIAVVGVFFIKPIYFIIGLGVFFAILIIGILDLVIAKKKNSNRNKKIIALKAEESKLVAKITAATNNQN